MYVCMYIYYISLISLKEIYKLGRKGVDFTLNKGCLSATFTFLPFQIPIKMAENKM